MSKEKEDEYKSLLQEIQWVESTNPRALSRDEMRREVAKSPILWLGMASIMGSIGIGLYEYYKGRGRRTQLMMRCRIALHIVAIASFLLGPGRKMMKQENKNY